MSRIWTDGCFDMFHWGHANALRQTRALGDNVSVGVHSDSEIEFHKSRPLVPEEERYEMVRACRWVDEVVDGSPYVTTLEVLNEHSMDFCVHGNDVSIGADGRDTYFEVKKAGKMKAVERSYGISTTEICNRILNNGNDGEEGKKVGNEGHFAPTASLLHEFYSGVRAKKCGRIVYVSGVWDLLNVGHLDILRDARRMGDYLIVGVLSDSASRLHTGRMNRPISSLIERSLLLLSMRYVDDVVIGCPLRIDESFVKQLGIDIVVTASREAAAFYGEVERMGILRVIPRKRDISTETVIKRISDNQDSYSSREAKKKLRKKKHSANSTE